MNTRTAQSRGRKLLELAQELRDSGANWVEANNAIFGDGGKFAELFPTTADRTAFAGTTEHKQLTELLATLPEPASRSLPQPSDVSGRLNVRMPKSIHAALIQEAADEGVSLNQLIVSKLALQLRTVAHA